MNNLAEAHLEDLKRARKVAREAQGDDAFNPLELLVARTRPGPRIASNKPAGEGGIGMGKGMGMSTSEQPAGTAFNRCAPVSFVDHPGLFQVPCTHPDTGASITRPLRISHSLFHSHPDPAIHQSQIPDISRSLRCLRKQHYSLTDASFLLFSALIN